MKAQIDKFKKHIVEHRKAYIVGGVVFVAGVTIGVLISKPETQSVVTKVFGNWKSDITVNNVIEQQLVRRGHPGFKIQCIETGEEFASIKRAASLLGISRSALTKHLKGSSETAGGYTFTNLGEMQ